MFEGVVYHCWCTDRRPRPGPPWRWRPSCDRATPTPRPVPCSCRRRLRHMAGGPDQARAGLEQLAGQGRIVPSTSRPPPRVPHVDGRGRLHPARGPAGRPRLRSPVGCRCAGPRGRGSRAVAGGPQRPRPRPGGRPRLEVGGHLDAGGVVVVAHPQLGEARAPQGRLGPLDLASTADGDLGAVGHPRRQAGRRRLVPGPAAEGLDRARTSALVNPASTSGKTAPRSGAASWPGRWSPRSSRFTPSTTVARARRRSARRRPSGRPCTSSTGRRR